MNDALLAVIPGRVEDAILRCALHIGESRDSGLDAEPVIGPRLARTRWHRPGMTGQWIAPRSLSSGSLFRHGRACPGHPRLSCSSEAKTWMPGTRPGMTRFAI